MPETPGYNPKEKPKLKRAAVVPWDLSHRMGLKKINRELGALVAPDFSDVDKILKNKKGLQQISVDIKRAVSSVSSFKSKLEAQLEESKPNLLLMRLEAQVGRKLDPRKPLKKREQEQLANLLQGVTEIKQLLSQINEGLMTALDFAQDLSGNEPPPYSRQLAEHAIQDIGPRVSELSKILADKRIESALNLKNIKLVAGKLGLMLSLSLAFGGSDSGRDVEVDENQVVESDPDSKIMNESDADESPSEPPNPTKSGEVGDGKINVGGEGEGLGGAGKSATPLNQVKEGESESQNIYGEGEKGELPNGDYIGEIKPDWDSHISDNLWATRYSHRVGNGQFTTAIVGSEIFNHNSSGREHDTQVVLKDMTFEAGQTIVLPLPPGPFEVDSVKANPPIRFQLTNDGNLSIKERGKTSFEYHVYRRSEDDQRDQYDFDKELSAQKSVILRDKIQQEFVQKLSETSAPDYEGILAGHLGEFNYVVSSDLNNLMAKLPGTFEEKVGLLRVGDCDALAAYLAGTLQDAGEKDVLIAHGYLSQDDRIDAARAHAKLVYWSGDGKLVSYETTAPTKNAFVNLKFEPDDLQVLTGLAGDISADDVPEIKLQKFAKLRDSLAQMLASGRYDDFESKEKFSAETISQAIDQVLAMLGDVKSFAKQFKRDLMTPGEEWVKSFIVMLMMLLGLTTLYGAGVAIEQLKIILVKKLRDDNFEEAAELIKNTTNGDNINSRDLTKTDKITDNEQLVMRDLETYYSQVQLPLQQVLPWAEVEKFTLEQKKNYLIMLSFCNSFIRTYGHEEFNFFNIFALISTALKRKNWHVIAAELASQGVNYQTLADKMKQVAQHPAIKEEVAREIPMLVDEVMRRAILIVQTNPGASHLYQQQVADDLVAKFVKNADIIDNKNTRTDSGTRSTRKRPSFSNDEEWEDTREYQLGDDLRHLDHHAMARTDKVMVKVYENKERPNKAVNKLDIVIDVGLFPEPTDMTDLAVGLIKIGESTRYALGSIRFVCLGKDVREPLSTSTGHVLDRIAQGGSGAAQDVKQVIKTVYELSLKHNILFDYDRSKWSPISGKGDSMPVYNASGVLRSPDSRVGPRVTNPI